MLKIERASRAPFWFPKFLGFSVQVISFDRIFWVAWVIRWRKSWPASCSPNLQTIEFAGFLLVVVLLSIIRLEVLRPCSTTSYWKPIIWKFFAQAPLTHFNMSSWVECVVLLGSLYDRVCRFPGLVFGKKLPLSNPIELRVLWHLGIGFTLRFVLLFNSVIAINCLCLYIVCSNLFSILLFLGLIKDYWWWLVLVEVDQLWLSSLFLTGMDLEFSNFGPSSSSIMIIVVLLLDLFLTTKSFANGIENNCKFCADFYLIAGTYEVTAWSTLVPHHLFRNNIYLMHDMFSIVDRNNDNGLLEGENQRANALVKKEKNPLRFENALDFMSYMKRPSDHYDFEDDMNNESISITGLNK